MECLIILCTMRGAAFRSFYHHLKPEHKVKIGLIYARIFSSYLTCIIFTTQAGIDSEP